MPTCTHHWIPAGNLGYPLQICSVCGMKRELPPHPFVPKTKRSNKLHPGSMVVCAVCGSPREVPAHASNE